MEVVHLTGTNFCQKMWGCVVWRIYEEPFKRRCENKSSFPTTCGKGIFDMVWQPVIPGFERRWLRRSILVCYCYHQKIKWENSKALFLAFVFYRKVTKCTIWGCFLLTLQRVLYLCALKVKGSLLWHKIGTSHKLLLPRFAYIITILCNYFWICLHNEKGNSFFSITVNIKMCLSLLHEEGTLIVSF